MTREEIIDAMRDEIDWFKQEERKLKQEGRFQEAHEKSQQAWNVACQMREEIIDAMWDEIDWLKQEERTLKQEGRFQEGRFQEANEKSKQAWNVACQMSDISGDYNEKKVDIRDPDQDEIFKIILEEERQKQATQKNKKD